MKTQLEIKNSWHSEYKLLSWLAFDMHCSRDYELSTRHGYVISIVFSAPFVIDMTYILRRCIVSTTRTSFSPLSVFTTQGLTSEIAFSMDHSALSSSQPLDETSMHLPPPPSRTRKRDLDESDDIDDVSLDSDSPWIVDKIRAVAGPEQAEIDKVYLFVVGFRFIT